ncbi:NAD(+)/NADH kinase [Candidatus Poribacteria bacterium]|nr:NAD(+)/NADH kinase [Candidatus Poribacteria bacterium]
MKRVGIIPNLTKPEAGEVALQTARWLLRRDAIPLLPDELLSKWEIEEPIFPLPCDRIALESEALIALGGDGTILNLVRLPGFDKVPILAVNLGGLGFMTEIKRNEIEEALEDLMAGRFSLDERMLLKVEVLEDDEIVLSSLALNEVVVKGFVRMIHLDAFIDGEHLATYPADGLIIATPSGSTAYSLSAGGPILHPNLDAILLCPICPHALTIRPFVAKSDSIVTVRFPLRDGSALVIIDGRETHKFGPHSSVRVRKSDKRLKLIRSARRGYCEVLRSKLKWGERAEDSIKPRENER